MSKRLSAEERILNHFESVSLPEAKVLFNVVKARIAQREAAIAPSVSVTPKKTRKRRTKSEMAAAKAEQAQPAQAALIAG